MADTQPALVDKFGRTITYVRLSVTDRCDFRCVYCMSEDMEFLPRDEILSLEEIGRLARIFQGLGVKKIRLTGGEPLVRKDILTLIQDIGSLGLDDFTMTTNGSQLPKLAHELKAAGMDRLNISLDSLDAEKFRRITRTGDLTRVIKGIDTAVEAGLKGIKLNSVIMKNSNDHEVLDLVDFARERGIDISFIEEMPLGEISDHSRDQTFCSSDEVREIIEQRYELIPSTVDTGGPSRYFRMPDSQSRIGFISPHSHNFCGDCNRVRMTVEGRLLLCLGNEHSKDLRDLLREHPEDDEPIRQAIISAMDLKPREHHFTTDGDVQIVRFMNMTGG
ncbi:cyclic pyranopterin monophosphate synthase subunit MoaA [Halospina denitrificans]|uniref:GTP 3',8-cyclase n=1 Tax=Halospina denitrificans TaxID=332522 RepID=A0A4R7K132_9GAMM|nr:GTP 3',8-cyclase MoaA [Halospina denitrificans]TDT44285.1 cyclic pyranopterin monophosphate synthase subunit MoaA [Halospina denitrificans]